MSLYSTVPIILTDKSRLQEIYDLRVSAYEDSPKSQYVNWRVFPNGWKDDLDELENTIHWIVENEVGKIVASARLAIVNNIHETGEPFDKFVLPQDRPFAYWSRLVVRKDYRKMNLMQALDRARKDHITNNNIPFAICCATTERHGALQRLGFNYLGDFYYNWPGKSTQNIQGFFMVNPSKK
jgi:predicted GNAT family N-acyltransferase